MKIQEIIKNKKQIEITITEKQQQKVYDTIEGLLEYDYDSFVSIRKGNGLGLGNVFLFLGILKGRGEPKAIKLHDLLSCTHRKTKFDIDLKIREQEKIKEITTNKNRFINSRSDSSNDETLKILNKYSTELSNYVVIGIHYYGQNYENKFGGTSLVIESETPGIYKEIINKYRSYKDS